MNGRHGGRRGVVGADRDHDGVAVASGHHHDHRFSSPTLSGPPRVGAGTEAPGCARRRGRSRPGGGLRGDGGIGRSARPDHGGLVVDHYSRRRGTVREYWERYRVLDAAGGECHLRRAGRGCLGAHPSRAVRAVPRGGDLRPGAGPRRRGEFEQLQRVELRAHHVVRVPAAGTRGSSVIGPSNWRRTRGDRIVRSSRRSRSWRQRASSHTSEGSRNSRGLRFSSAIWPRHSSPISPGPATTMSPGRAA